MISDQLEAAAAEASADAELWRDLPSSDYGMASKTARQEEEGKRKVGSKNGATGRSDIEHVRSGIARVDGNAAR